jgi:hypothetical protein
MATTTFVHYDGLGWQIEDSGTTRDLIGVWAIDQETPLVHDIWVSGAGGTLLRKDLLDHTYITFVRH